MFIPDPQHSILLIYLKPTESTYCTVPQPTFSSQKIERKAVLHGSALHCKVGSGSTSKWSGSGSASICRWQAKMQCCGSAWKLGSGSASQHCWWPGTSNRVVVPTHQAGNRFLGSLKGLQIRALLCREKNFNSSRSPRQRVNLQFYNVRMKLVTNRLARSCLAFT